MSGSASKPTLIDLVLDRVIYVIVASNLPSGPNN
jgi:hypothetical protein